MESATVSTASLEAIVREQLQMIDKKIHAHPRTFGRNIITVDLSTSFNIPGLERMEQQRYIYSNICRSLINRHYEVGLMLLEDVAKLLIAFTVQFDQKEVNAMEMILQQVLLVEQSQVDSFIKGGEDSKRSFPRKASSPGGRSSADPKLSSVLE